MSQTLRIKTAGGLTKMSLSPRVKKKDGYQTRKEKHRMSSNAQKYINSRAQHSKLEFSLAANIRPGDWFLTITYDNKNLPDCWERANRCMQALCRKLRESRKPEKTIYFYNIERNHYSDENSQNHRWHHHMVLSGDVDLDELARLWGRGHVNGHRIRIDPDHTYDSLATYLLKECNEFAGKRGWRASQGLSKPETDTMIVPDDYTITPPETEGMMVLENSGPQHTVYGKIQTIKFQRLDGCQAGAIPKPKSRKKSRRKKRRRAKKGTGRGCNVRY